MADVRVEVFRTLQSHLAEIVTPEMAERAEKVAARAKATAPRRSGRWADSIHVEPHLRPGAFRVGSDDPRSVHIEYGTSDTPEHATLRKALDAAKEG